MKVFVSCDMEGISGIPSWFAASDKNANYFEGRELMTADVNAVIAAAFDAGAEAVCIRDAHGSAQNLLASKLDPRAQLISGWSSPARMVGGIDAGFAAVVLVGYHARAGTADGLMCHTMTRAFRNVRINGVLLGEIGLSAMHAGHYGVPVVALTGDDAACREARELLPWVATATTKWALGRECARMLPPAQACERIAEAVREGLASVSRARPLTFDAPLRVEVEFTEVNDAARWENLPNATRIDSYVVIFEVFDGEQAAVFLGLVD